MCVYTTVQRQRVGGTASAGGRNRTNGLKTRNGGFWPQAEKNFELQVANTSSGDRNGRFRLQAAKYKKVVLQKCAALPAIIAIFMFFVKTA